MKHYLSIGMLFFCLVLLASCASRNGSPFPRTDYTEETWMQSVDTNPAKWARGADSWFMSGEANSAEQASRQAPDSAAISTMLVRVPGFNGISVNGPFQVQIFGATEQNSVYVYGPNDLVRQVDVKVHGNTLNVVVSPDAASNRQMGQVIVRIGIVNLMGLVQKGSGRIEGRQLNSTGLKIISSGSGNIYLAGTMNVKCITQTGSGSVTVWGAVTPMLDIETNGSGCVNVSGNVGLRSIQHHGKSDVNIIGANSDNLLINTDGRGKIGIVGIVNARDIRARGHTCVLICGVNSANLNAYSFDDAVIGVSGRANELYVNAAGSSRFWGRNLCVINAYVRASGSAHINVMATNKIFASSVDDSSVYFFGTPDLMSQFVSGNGTVIPIWFDNRGVCTANLFPVYKDQPGPYRAHHRYHWKHKKMRGVKGEG